MQSIIQIDRKLIAQSLHEVADPEIPGISIVDLGMVIDIREAGDLWHIILAPTYSGCPAIDVIPLLVESHLKHSGIENFQVAMEISPPWSTSWISEEGKSKLAALGYAPPNPRSVIEDDIGKPKHCPHCGSEKTELISRFSSTPCKAAYKCTSCLEPFEYFKCY